MASAAREAQYRTLPGVVGQARTAQSRDGEPSTLEIRPGPDGEPPPAGYRGYQTLLDDLRAKRR